MNAENSTAHGRYVCTPCGPRTGRRYGLSRGVLLFGAMLCGGPALAEFVTSPVTTAHVGVPYVYDVEAAGSGNVVITSPNGLPSWLTLERTGNGSARLHGTPQASDMGAGIVLRSEDSTCRLFLILCYRYQFFDITIIENTPPRIVAPGIADQTATEGTAFALDVSSVFEDPDGDVLTLDATGLPDGFTLTAGTIAGTPTAAHVQSSPFDVRIAAHDGRGGAIEEAFVLRVDSLRRADLAVTALSASPSPVIEGERAVWSVTIENLGPNESGSASVTIDLSGRALVLDEHECTSEMRDDGERLVCTLAPLASGGAATIELEGAATEAGDVYAVATVAPLGDRPIELDGGNDRMAAALNVGGALSSEPAQRLGDPAIAAAAADLDGDGFDDVVAATDAGAPAGLHLNVENPSTLHAELAESDDARRGLAALPLSLGDDPAGTGAAIGDFDGDGDLDVVIVSASAPAVLYVNDGNGALVQSATFGDPATTRAVAAADIDGDGRADIVLANDGDNTVYLNRSGADFDAVPLGGPRRESVGVAVVDLDGDGLPEIVFANADGDASYHSHTGSEFTPPTPIATGPTSSIAAGDLNGDGSADLVFARMQPGPDGVPSNPVYLSDGLGGLSLAAELGRSPTADVLMADVDGDGAVDVIAINATGAHQIFVNDGQGGLTMYPTLLVEPGAVAGLAARVGMRETTDLVVAGTSGLSVFLNDGSGHFGLGDTGRPVIELRGEPEISLEIESAYQDPGATAVDDIDGELAPSVDNPVDSKVIGTYVVTYTAFDSAGNAAVPVTRTVRVEARNAQGGGGGGAADAALLALAVGTVLLGLILARRGRRSTSEPFPLVSSAPRSW